MLAAEPEECIDRLPLVLLDPNEDTVESRPRSVYDEAKSLFHRSAQVRMVGRTVERAFIERFWSSAIDGNTNDPAEKAAMALYVCGNPGTGKTALIQEMVPEMVASSKKPVRLIQINCMMQHSIKDILEFITVHIQSASAAAGTTKTNKSRKRKSITPTQSVNSILEQSKMLSEMLVIILDEVDQLAEGHADLLETIFGWSLADGSRIRVIGIANSIDLTIKRFASSSELNERVAVLNFSPYSPEDIARILMARMELTAQTSRTPLIAPVAIELCSRKVSAVGDLRKALEIMRDAIGLAEKDHFQTKITRSADNDKSMITQVTIKHVAAAMEKIFGVTQRTRSRHSQIISNLNLHQKLLLANLYLLLHQDPTHKPTVHLLFDRYASLIRQHRIVESVSRSEFGDLLSNAESMGILSLIAPGKRAKTKTVDSVSAISNHQVVLSIPLDDVEHGLSENHLFKQIISS